MRVQPGLKVEWIESDQPADPHDRDAPLLDQATDVADARAELLGHRVDVEQPQLPADHGSPKPGPVHWPSTQCASLVNRGRPTGVSPHEYRSTSPPSELRDTATSTTRAKGSVPHSGVAARAGPIARRSGAESRSNASGAALPATASAASSRNTPDAAAATTRHGPTRSSWRQRTKTTPNMTTATGEIIAMANRAYGVTDE